MTMYDDLPAPEEGPIFTRFLTIRDGAASWRFYADILGGKILLEENPASSRPPTALEHTLRPMFSYLHTIVSPRRGSAPPPTTSAPSKACPARTHLRLTRRLALTAMESAVGTLARRSSN
jgi:hypothetical protein